MGNLKKYLCLLIAVVFLTAVVPTVALADDPTPIYVSAEGGSDSNQGTKESPYATLTKAVEEAKDGATIYVMSDLTMDSMARIVDKDVTITSEGGPWTINRGENMASASDNARSWYNPAMIEVTTPNSKGASVTLTNITLDDQGRHTCVDTDGKTYGYIYAQVGVGAADHREYVQDAMVAAYGTDTAKAEINLNDGAVLKNYGGMSAVRVTGGALLTMNTGSKICDDVSENGTLTYAQDRVEKHNDGSSTGAAGAVWVQGTTAKLNTGSEISGVVGRAIYADGGSVTMNGSINNITGNANMWQGQNGVAIHVRSEGTQAILNGNISEINGNGSSAVFVCAKGSFTMNQGSKMNAFGTGVKGIQLYGVAGGTVNMDGEITGIQNDNAININLEGKTTPTTGVLKCTIGPNGNIHNNTVRNGAVYMQTTNGILDIYGKINHNINPGDTSAGGLYMAHNHNESIVTMYPGAEICNNYANKYAGVIVSMGTFTMKGGTISGNIGSASSEGYSGVYVRNDGVFIMENGEISNNSSAAAVGGLSYDATEQGSETLHPNVLLKGGTISENDMNAIVDSENHTASGGTPNDVSVTTSGSSNIDRYITISSNMSIGTDSVFMQKYNFSIERPGEGVKFGNAAAACETAVTNALSSQNLTEVVGSMWYQTDKDTLPLTVYDLTENEKYDETKDLYAAVVDTKADGTPVENASVSLYAVDVSEADGSFEVKLPGGATDGTAVVFLQEGEEPAIVVSLKPVNLTAYMGGDAGYDQVVDTNNPDSFVSTSLPHPLFTVTGVEDAEDMVFSESGTNKKWTLVKDGTGYYHFLEGNGQDPVRVTYTNDTTGETTLSDSFKLEDVHELFNTYTVSLYTGSVDMSKVKATLNGQDYTVALGTGTLTVRAVEKTDPTSSVKTITPADPVAAGSATAVVPAGTTYTLNGLDGVTIPSDADPSLLFDDIIASDGQGAARKEALKTAVDKTLGGAGNDRNYEYKYLDLVDANNGNAWIKASNNVTIYWGYPQGTDENTTFKLVHFKDLHRDTSGGAESGIDPSDITTAKTEIIDVKTTDQGITFEVTPGNFSPYVLVWEDNTTPDPDPTPTPDPEEPELERGDHYAYIFGYEDDTIRPDNDITRAEVATIFYRLLTDASRDEYRTTDNNFTDVSEDAWYNETVSTLANAGVLAGYEDGSFRPDAPITRAEYAAIATRFDDLAAGTSSFTDISGHWAEAAINAAYSAGWVGGYEDGTFRPDQNITRAEAMALINRVLERAVDSDGMLDDMQRWVDCHPGAWYYADVQEATNSHDYEREEGEKYETWTELLPNKVF